jgi:hypothetical protein
MWGPCVNHSSPPSPSSRQCPHAASAPNDTGAAPMLAPPPWAKSRQRLLLQLPKLRLVEDRAVVAQRADNRACRLLECQWQGSQAGRLACEQAKTVASSLHPSRARHGCLSTKYGRQFTEGYTHDGRLIGRGARNQELDGNWDTRRKIYTGLGRQRDVIPFVLCSICLYWDIGYYDLSSID